MSGTPRAVTGSPMQRGDVYLVDLDPTRGTESNKVRPAVIVSNNAANRTAQRNRRGAVTVVPVTSNTDRVHPFQVLLPAGEGGLTVDSKAQAEQRHHDLRLLPAEAGQLADPLEQLLAVPGTGPHPGHVAVVLRDDQPAGVLYAGGHRLREPVQRRRAGEDLDQLVGIVRGQLVGV